MNSLVVLNDADLAYRQSCIESDVAFSESFLLECRAQRLRCSVRDLDCMLRYERNRHLAEEAICMRLSSWATDPPTYIDWKSINARAAAKGESMAAEFAAWRKWRSEIAHHGTQKPRK